MMKNSNIKPTLAIPNQSPSLALVAALCLRVGLGNLDAAANTLLNARADLWLASTWGNFRPGARVHIRDFSFDCLRRSLEAVSLVLLGRRFRRNRITQIIQRLRKLGFQTPRLRTCHWTAKTPEDRARMIEDASLVYHAAHDVVWGIIVYVRENDL